MTQKYGITVEEVTRLYNSGYTDLQIARRFGCGTTTIFNRLTQSDIARRAGLKPAQAHPIDPTIMLRACLKLAADLEREAREGEGSVSIHMTGNNHVNIPRAEAASRMAAQAERWRVEVETGVRNVVDRGRVG